MPTIYCDPCRVNCDPIHSTSRQGDVYLCPSCGGPMWPRPEALPPNPPGHRYEDITWTPELAWRIIDELPEDSYHWVDIPKDRPGEVQRYAQLMRDGLWQNTLLAHGRSEHPVRFDGNGSLRFGAMRLLAVIESGVTIRHVTFGPDWKMDELS